MTARRSDYLDTSSWHKVQLYEEVYKPIGCEDSLEQRPRAGVVARGHVHEGEVRQGISHLGVLGAQRILLA